MATRDALGEGDPQVPLTAGPLKEPPPRARNKGAAPGARCARPGATSGELSRRPLTSRVSGEGCARPARLALHAAVSPGSVFLPLRADFTDTPRPANGRRRPAPH